MKATLIILTIVAGFGGPFEKRYDYETMTDCRIAVSNMRLQERPDGGAFAAFCVERK